MKQASQTAAVVPETLLPLPRTSVVAMVLLQIVTLGLYEPIWYLRRRDAFWALHDSTDPSGEAVLLVVLAVLSILVGALAKSSGNPVVLGLFVSIKPAIDTRAAIVAHLHAAGVESVRLSVVATVLQRVFYLQWKINRCATAQAAR